MSLARWGVSTPRNTREARLALFLVIAEIAGYSAARESDRLTLARKDMQRRALEAWLENRKEQS